MIKYKNKEFLCSLDLGIEVLRGKWRAVILYHLSKGPMRFLGLQRNLEGISQKVLNQHLKVLEEEALIAKKVYPEVPPRVEYFLTKKGEELVPALVIIKGWSEKYNSPDEV